MHFALKDWKRLWRLVPIHEAGRLQASGESGQTNKGAAPEVLDAGAAKAVLSRLLPEAGNPGVLRNLLAAEAKPLESVPTHAAGVLNAVLRLLGSRRYVLVRGPERIALAHKPFAPESEWIPIESADWREEGDPPAPEETPPGIACEHEVEAPPSLEVACEVDAPLTLAFEHEIETP